MKPFIRNVFFFLIILSILVFLIDCISISDAYIIQKTKGTSYQKIAWNLNLINHHPEKISGSIIFLGPSLTQGGICDSTLSANGIKSINMGINHHGKEMELFFLNKIISYQPKKVYLHFSKYELTDLHPMTPLLYSPLSLLSAGQSFNIPFVNFLYRRVSFVLDYLLWTFTIKSNVSENYSEFGVRYQKTEYTNEAYNGIDKTHILSPHYKEGNLRSFIRHFILKINFISNAASQELYSKTAFENGNMHHIKMAEIYIPAVIDAKSNKNFDSTFYYDRNPTNLAYLESFAFLDSAMFWSDLNHLSQRGAILFTQHMVSQHTLDSVKNDIYLIDQEN
jgi:hypothetical protein